MLRRGIKTLNELNTAKNAKREAAEKAKAERYKVKGILSDPALNNIGSLFLDLSPNEYFQASLGIASRTPLGESYS